MTEIAKISSKGQVTSPAEIRKALRVRAGDSLAWEIETDGRVVIRRVTPLDLDYLIAVSGTLSEWDSDQDDEAYRGL